MQVSASFLGSMDDYAGSTYGPIFYDFKAIYHPLGSPGEVAPEL